MNNNKQQKNGVAQLGDAAERMRLQVVETELRARYWKANAEIKEYMIKDRALKPEYDALMEKILEEEKKTLEDLRKQMIVNEEHGITMDPVEQTEGELVNESEEQTQ